MNQRLVWKGQMMQWVLRLYHHYHEEDDEALINGHLHLDASVEVVQLVPKNIFTKTCIYGLVSPVKQTAFRMVDSSGAVKRRAMQYPRVKVRTPPVSQMIAYSFFPG